MNAQEISHPRLSGVYDVVAIAASAGGLRALSILLGALPADLPACLLVVQHLDPAHHSLMAEILGPRTALRVKQAEDGETPGPGTVYIGIPDRHLLLTDAGTIALSAGAPANFSRPSADVLFESVAATRGQRAIAVILTGTGSDGSRGACAIHQAGGRVIAQDEASSEFFGMPRAAIRAGCVDHVIALPAIALALKSLVTTGEIQ